jgi:hypothetical protein
LVSEMPWNKHDEADVVLTTSAGTSGHLLQLIRRQRTPAFVPRASALLITTVRAGKSTPAATVEGANIAVHQPCRHHLLHQQFPRRHVSGMMCRNTGVDQYLRVFVGVDLGIFLSEFIEHRLSLSRTSAGRVDGFYRQRPRMRIRRIYDVLAGKLSPEEGCIA